MIQISPSILSADFANLQQDLQRISHADMVHVDVMDGHFVPNISIGIPVVQAVKKATPLPLDVHLMITQPERYVLDFIKAGASRLTLHIESTTPQGLQKAFDLMDEHGVEKGLALRPITKVSSVLPFLPQLHQVLVMTVEPGFGGQKFMDSQLPSIQEAATLIVEHNPTCALQVDGGIDIHTAPLVTKAGATVLVAGSAVYGSSDPNAMIDQLRATP